MLVNDGGIATQPRAPGHERPHAALCAARHGRLSAASTAPGADVPPATMAGAPGQYCQSAAPRAPGHGRPLAITAGLSCRDRLSAAPIATVALPVGPRRLRQAGLPHTPANPRTQTHQDSTRTPTTNFRAIPSPCTAGGPQGGQPTLLPLSKCWRGGRGVRSPSHQVHPAIQVPPYPRPCSTAAGGFPLHHPSRAPPPRHCGFRRNPRPPTLRGDQREANHHSPLHMVERGRG